MARQTSDSTAQSLLRHERLHHIREAIRRAGHVRVDELSERFGVSEYTIRRDLAELEAESVLRRTYGGAVAYEPILQEMRRWSRREEFRSRADLRLEYQERIDSGYLVDSIAERIKNPEGLTPEQVEALWAAIEELPMRADFPYTEPSTLSAIRAERPAGPRRLSVTMTAAELRDRIYAAWLGRCAGCLLGMPVEAIGRQREPLVSYLKMASAYPPDDYLSEVIPLPDGYELVAVEHGAVRERIDGMPHDDDIMYTLLALHILEEHGFGFEPHHVASEWLDHLPFHAVFTAERIAYRNLVLGLHAPETASFRNPYREFIGAQIRADQWGYVSVGAPEQAAELAFRDASLSHAKNGLYGAMFVAAMLAAAYTTDDVEAVVHIGLSEIPARSRLAEAVQQVVGWAGADDHWEQTIDRIWETYGRYDPTHTINNAAVVVASLLHGRDDFTRTIGVAVAGGFDTDCNGATVGSIFGLMHGVSALPEKWTAPLQDRIRFQMMGFSEMRISDLAYRSYLLARQSLEALKG